MRLPLFGLLLLSACATPSATVATAPPVDAGVATPAAPMETKPVQPTTRSQVVNEPVHGVMVKDAYRWLEDEKSAEVQAWMKAQDRFTRDRLAELDVREQLQSRYAQLYYLDAVGTPVKRGGRYFYVRTHKTKEKAVVYWRQGASGEEKVLLDPNTWSTDNTVSLGRWVPSWDGKKVVFAQKPNAADESTLYVLDVDTGARSAVDVIPGGKYASPSWAADSKSFVYEWLPTDSSIPVSERPGFCEVRRHVLGTEPVKDEVLHPRTGDPKTFIGGGLSRDGKYLLVSIMRGWNENDVYFKRVGKDAQWRLLVKGDKAKYSVTVWKDVFYVFTDEAASNGRVFKADPAQPERARWKELVPEDPTSSRSELSIIGGHLALTSLRKAASRIELFTLAGKRVRDVELPGLGTSGGLSGLEDDDEAFFSFSSFVDPPQVLRTSIKSGKSEVWAKVEVPVDPSPYEVRQVEYPSKDGTRVTMFIVARRDVVLDGNNPVLLYGYGGFDVSLTSSFTGFIYPWLEAGGVYAVPNLRGGGEYGTAWHDAGKHHLKQNVFDDFAAAAEYLIAQKWTSPGRLGIRGGSNGGLLVGAAMTQRPELFGAVICAVPLLDMARYHLYGSGKTWIPEYGDPEVAGDFKTLLAYSPYHRVQDGVAYPPLLMMSADHDDRVDPFHARKFVARVQSAQGGKGTAWLRIEANAGHGGADQVAKSIVSSTDQIAFLMHALSVGATKSK